MIKHALQKDTVKIGETSIPIMGSYDVVVAGGGVAGCAAAVAAGKRGFKTLIVEACTALGGLATLGLVNIPLDYVSGMGKEMLDDLKAVNGYWHRNTDPEKHKLVLERMMKRYHVDILYNTPVVDSIMEADTITGIVIQTKTGRRAIMAKRVIDCTGDSDVAYYAGAKTVMGRVKDSMSQACSLEFTMGGVDWDKYLASDLKRDDPKWIELIHEKLESGDLPYEIENHLNWITHLPGRPEHCGKDEVSLCICHSRNCFPIDPKDLTRMYLEGREHCHIMCEFIKKFVPGFENAYLINTGALLGVRESRRIVGEYVLTSYDVASLRKFDDVICISSHGYDIHNYEAPGNIKWVPMQIGGETKYVICNTHGYGSSTPPPDGKLSNYLGEDANTAEFEPNSYYDIPWRCLIPEKVDNLLAAGRNISTDVEAQSAIRLIMACFTMGEAAGTATAISLVKNIPVRKVERIALQTELIQNGVNIGQNYRTIPGIEATSAGAHIDEYVNPEAETKEEIKSTHGKRKLDNLYFS